MNELKRLLESYPLPQGWSRPELIANEIVVGSLKVSRVGLHSSSGFGAEAIGSAAGTAGSELERAYFELIERVAVIDFEHRARKAGLRELTVVETDAGAQTRVALQEGFPVSDSPERFQFAKSNGAAAHMTFAEAARRARLEAVERDRVLRCWYGQVGARPVTLGQNRVLSALRPYYEFEALAIEGNVVALFGWPLAPETPLWISFGAADGLEPALEKAVSEGLQRAAMLWDEPVPSSVPGVSPNAAFHLDYYLCPSTHAALREWVSDSRAHSPVAEENKDAAGASPVFCVDVTPDCLKDKLVVVKAFGRRLLPLVFGEPPEPTPSGRRVHPIA